MTHPVPKPPPDDQRPPLLTAGLLTHIANHATSIIPLTDLAGVLINVLGQETLIANDRPAPGYLLIFLDSPPPPMSH